MRTQGCEQAAKVGELDVRRCHEPGEGHHLAAVTRLGGDEHPAREPKSLRLEEIRELTRLLAVADGELASVRALLSSLRAQAL